MRGAERLEGIYMYSQSIHEGPHHYDLMMLPFI